MCFNPIYHHTFIDRYESMCENRKNGDDGKVFTVSEKLDDEITENLVDILTQISKHQHYRSVSVPNEGSLRRTRGNRWSSDKFNRSAHYVESKQGVRFQDNRKSKLNRLRSSLYKSKRKKYPNTCREFYNPTFEPDDGEVSIEDKQSAHKPKRMVGVNSMSELTNPWKQDIHPILEHNRSPLSDRAFFSKTDNCKMDRKRYETWPSPKTRKRSVKMKDTNNSATISDIKGNRGISDSVRIINEIPMLHYTSCSENVSAESDSDANLALKDNRVKSSLRDHAMSTVERRSHSMAFDKGAVEALSKEDLLVLWKRSEIELQTRLNRTLHQNNHLRQLVHIAEVFHGQDSEGASLREISNEMQSTVNQEIDNFTVTRL